jgi:hypothetical protein
MAQGDPAGWESLGTNDPTKYKATFRLNRTQGTGQIVQSVRVITNRSNGNYDVYTTSFGAGDELIYSYNTSTNETIVSNSGVYEQIFTGNNRQQFNNLNKDIRSSTLKLAENNISGGNNSTSYNEFQQLKNSPGYKSLTNATTPDPPSGVQPPGANPQQTPQLTPFEDPDIKSEYTKTDYEHLVYPTRLDRNSQDYIQFVSYTYTGRSFSPSQNSSGAFSPGIGKRDFTKTNGSVTLPIQSQSPNTNSVQWGSSDLNAFSAAMASLSYGIMTSGGQAVGDFTDRATDILKNDPNMGTAFRLYAAGNAVGVGGLLSRVGGGILNPNMELLFQGPQLRPFTFDFRLSPRNNAEAKTVKKIIRYFKQNMSVKTTADGIFLKAPNIFKIKYYNGDKNEHTSLNKIKECALTSCSVNYTPDSQYMTFKDPDSGYPMTAYNISLQFQELEPITESDYKDLNPNEIGY